MIRLFISLGATLLIGLWLPMALHSQWLHWFITLPGTALHETAHWIPAFVLGGNPDFPNLFPGFSNGQMVSYGSVMFVPTMWNAATVALAPLLVLIPSVHFIFLAARTSVLRGLGWCYASACGFASFVPSPADWGVAVTLPISFLIAVPIFGAVTLAYFAYVKRTLKNM